MTTSGTYSFSLTKTNIIKRAFQVLNIYDLANTISSDDASFASDMLNGIIKSLQAEGIKLWKRKTAYLFPALDTYQYDLGSVSGAEHCTNTYVATTVSSASGTSVTVASSTGMTVSDFIGIELDNGTRFWTTITNIASTVLTINDSITSTASSGNTVVTYTSKINRPLEIIDAVNIDIANDNVTTDINIIDPSQFFKIPLKSTEGNRVAQASYDKVLSGAIPSTSRFSIFPSPQDVNVIIGIRYYDGIQDMLNNTDDPDFPQEWTQTLIWLLAEELCVPYGRMQELQVVQGKAQQYKTILEYFDADMEPLRFQSFPNK